MMSNFFVLVKNNCLVFIGSLKGRKNGRTVVAAAVMGLLFAFIGFSLAMSAVVQTLVLAEAGVPELSIYLGLISALTLGILFGLMRSANAPVSRDADLLLSMPLRRVTVVCSKIVSQYVFDAPLMIAVFGSTVVAYFVVGERNVGILTRGLLLMFLLPLIPMALSYLLGSVMAILQRKFRLTGIITTGILMVLFIGYMFMNFQSSSLLSGVETLGRQSALDQIDRVAPLSWLTHFVLDGNVVPVVLSLLLLILPFALGVIVFSTFFGKQRDTYHSNSKILLFTTHSPKMSLLIKEVRRYLACSIYVFNTAFGPLLLIVFTVALAIMGPGKILALVGISAQMQTTFSKETMYIILTGLLCFFPTATCTSAVAISLEGNQLWILKAHPIRTADIFWAKYMLNILLMVPVSILASIVIGIRMQMNFPEILGMTAAPAVLGVYVAFIGLICNLLFPRFDWTSETTVVKQSMSVVVALSAGMVSALVPFGIYYFVLRQAYGFMGLCAVCVLTYAVMSVGAYSFLKTTGKKLFKAL